MMRTMRLRWWVLFGVLAVVLVTWFAAYLLLGEADRAGVAARPAARIEAIRTSLTVAAGAGALFALGLAMRRQWHTELDSRERRVTDLYVQAVEQLGSERAPVRLGGMYALTRLGQANPDHRQTVMDVLCAYLRMPFDEDGPAEERQVRQTAQRLLATHLQQSTTATFWAGMNIDLSGATLIGFNFHACQVEFANFFRARFTGPAAEFYAAAFRGGVRLENATSTTPPPTLPPGWRSVPGEKEGEWRIVESGAVDEDGVEGAGQ